MAHRMQVLICPSCPDEKLDTTRMFLRGNTAVVLCRLCGREFVIASDLKCSHKGCSSSVTDLICSKYTNVADPVACFCDEHTPRGFSRWFQWHLLAGGQETVPFIPDAVTGKCVKCGGEIRCSNKYMFTRCAACGTQYHKQVHFFGPDTLAPFEDVEVASTDPAAADPNNDSDFSAIVAEQLLAPESEQFAVICPHCGRKHPWNEERTRNGKKETLLDVIEVVYKSEQVARQLGMSNMLNRADGWFCTQCGETIPHDYLLASLNYGR